MSASKDPVSTSDIVTRKSPGEGGSRSHRPRQAFLEAGLVLLVVRGNWDRGGEDVLVVGGDAPDRGPAERGRGAPRADEDIGVAGIRPQWVRRVAGCRQPGVVTPEGPTKLGRGRH